MTVTPIDDKSEFSLRGVEAAANFYADDAHPNTTARILILLTDYISSVCCGRFNFTSSLYANYF